MRSPLSRALAGAALAGVLARAPQAPDVLPGEPFERLDEGLRRDLALAFDARADGWGGEELARVAGAQLERLAAFLEPSDCDPARVPEGVLAADLAVRWPASAAATAHGTFQLRRAGSERESLDRDAFVRALCGLLAGARERHARFEVVRAEEGAPRTEVVLALAALGPEGPLQLESRWRCLWRVDPAGTAPPALREVEVVEQEELRAPAFVFRDQSEPVFGANAAWSQVLAPGLGDWRARLDARLGLGLAGCAAGLALGDVDGDGLEDLYVCQPGGLPNELFLHRPDGSALERAASAGVDFLDDSRAALLVDLDGDERRDLVLGTGERLLVLTNDGKARFWLAAALAAPATTSLAAADVDLDGDLDLYACAGASPYDHAAPPQPFPDARGGPSDRLLENRGEAALADVTAERMPEREAGRSALAAAFEDYDLDGDPDLYVANEFGRGDLYLNDGGKFRALAAEAGLADVASGTGITWGDVDGDGDFDLFASGSGSATAARVVAQARFQPAAGAELRARLGHAGGVLRENRGDGTFREPAASPFGPTNSGWGFGALFADLDGDGWQDLLAPAGFLSAEQPDDLSSFLWCDVLARAPLAAAASDGADAYRRGWSALNKLLRRGHSLAGRAANHAYLNLDGHGFADASAVSGFALAHDARACALVDWDGDGDLDVFLSGRLGPRLRYLENERDASNRGVTLELRGTRSNRDAIGARVELGLRDARGAERKLVRGVRAGEGFLSQSSSRLTFGLGPAGNELVSVRVSWPGGEAEEFRGVAPGRAWRLVQGAGRAVPLERAPSSAAALSAPAPSASAPAAPVAGRVALVRPVPLPRIELTAEDGRTLALFGLAAGGGGTGTGKPLLLAPFSESAACAAELAELARHADELQRAGLAPLALSIEPAETRARAKAFLQQCGWPFPSATAGAETLELLDALQAILLDGERRLPLPSSFLVDRNGALRVFYLGPVSAAQLVSDRALCELGEGEQLDAATPLRGRWMFPHVPDDADFFEARLRERGLESAAREFARGRLTVLRSSPADLLHEFGRESAAAGRFDEAQNFFRRALAVDPRHFATLSDWALVLHHQEKLAEAAELYGKALAVDPGHADTHFNLALALLGLGDRAGAENQLRWLRAHGQESADVLERALGDLDAPR